MNYKKLLLYLSIPLLIGFFGSLLTGNAIPEWYSTLNKPSFSPPNWLFAPVWTLLYIAMGTAAYLISESKSRHRKTSLNLYWTQLALNGIWTPIFFGLRSPVGGLIVIAALLVTLAATIFYFNKVNKTSSYLMVPYILWVAFATALNLSIVLIN